LLRFEVSTVRTDAQGKSEGVATVAALGSIGRHPHTDRLTDVWVHDHGEDDPGPDRVDLPPIRWTV
jgi:hypothetical protein